jgi:hypothetical protein
MPDYCCQLALADLQGNQYFKFNFLLKEETNVIKLGAQHGRTNILNANSFKIC